MCYQRIEFEYYDSIKRALEKLYKHDYVLLDPNRKTHEQTISFRLALYLAQEYERGESNCFVDCEYHGDCNNENGRNRKCFSGNVSENVKFVRPDIICHHRGIDVSCWEDNLFCIEIKKRSAGKDYEKIGGYLFQYGYHEGFCIYNIGQRYVTIRACNEDNYATGGVTYRLEFSLERQSFEECKPKKVRKNEMSGVQK